MKQESVLVEEFCCLVQLSLVSELDPMLVLKFGSHQRLVVGSVQHRVCPLTPHLSRHLAQKHVWSQTNKFLPLDN